MNQITANRVRRGFSLTELAIVLGILGVILGGVWAIADHVREKVRQEKTFDEVVHIVKNMRSIYQGQSGINTGLSAAALTNTLIRQGVIPSDLIRSRTAGTLEADHPWGDASASGTLQIAPYNTDTQRFQLLLNNLPASACVHMATRMSNATALTGLDSVSINGTWVSAPVTVQQATDRCNLSGKTNLILLFRLRLQR